MNVKAGGCLTGFAFPFLLKVRLSKLQKTKNYQHVAGPAAKMLIGEKNDSQGSDKKTDKTSTLWVPPKCLALCLTDSR